MKKKYIVWGISILICAVGLYIGDISLQWGKGGNLTHPATQQEIVKQFSILQNITGEFFRSPKESLAKELQLFGSAKKNLDIWTYDFTQKDFKKTLKNLAASGVNIRIIVEDKKFQQFQNTLKVLIQDFSGFQNIQLKSDKQMGTEYTHAKVNLIDSGYIIQTANLTNTSFASNREHFLQGCDTGIRNSLHTIFSKDRNGQKITAKDIHPNLVVCNINCRGVIEQLLNSAKKSIIIQTQYITDDAIRSILKTKKNISEFKLLVANTQSNDDLLRFFGPTYAKKFKKHYNHTKMILVDQQTLLLGSMNLSSTSLDKNREIGIILLDTGIINTFSTQFYADRSSTK